MSPQNKQIFAPFISVSVRRQPQPGPPGCPQRRSATSTHHRTCQHQELHSRRFTTHHPEPITPQGEGISLFCYLLPQLHIKFSINAALHELNRADMDNYLLCRGKTSSSSCCARHSSGGGGRGICGSTAPCYGCRALAVSCPNQGHEGGSVVQHLSPQPPLLFR